MVESADMEEPQIQRADYKLYVDFQLRGGLVPLTPKLFKGQFTKWAIQNEQNVVNASIWNVKVQ